MKEYIHEIETPIIRRLWMIPSVLAIAVLGIIFFVCSAIGTPSKIKIHANFTVALFLNGVISMWNGHPHISLPELNKKYYK